MKSSRQLVQYGDLEQPHQIHGASSSAVDIHASQQHPSKRLKKPNQKPQRSEKTPHWDDPEDLINQMDYDELEEEESRELTHEEIWDDSALIDAWNSATAEYEAFHGKSQEWKSDSKPVKKSPLWYNIPYDSSKDKAKRAKTTVPATEVLTQAIAEGEEDSAPLDFNTFAPSYDPSLPVSSEPPAVPEPSFFVPAPSNAMVSRDEAFNRALSAVYWGGYWTAVYQCQSSQEVVEEQDQEHEEGEVLEDDVEDLVPAQR